MYLFSNDNKICSLIFFLFSLVNSSLFDLRVISTNHNPLSFLIYLDGQPVNLLNSFIKAESFLSISLKYQKLFALYI